jgi:bifunctional non-homologous end joining protein LigD
MTDPRAVRYRRLALAEEDLETARSDILLSRSFDIDGAHMFKTACEMGLEGVVSKRRDSRYTSDKTGAWLKVTCRQRETLQISRFFSEG